jgi:hypothetical protein
VATWRIVVKGAVTSALVLMPLLATIGCDDDRTVTFPASASGTIRGRVSDGAPIDSSDVVVRVSSINYSGPRFTAEMHPDANGDFEFTVPNGPVFVSMSSSCDYAEIYYRASGLTFRQSEADTIEVAGEVYRTDFACGRVSVTVDLPPDLPTDYLNCSLLPPGRAVTSSIGCRYDAQDQLSAEMRLVRPGRYRLAVTASSLGGIYLPATLDSNAAPIYTVVAGEALHHVSQLPPLAHLEGSVTGSWQEFGLDVPRVEVWRDNRGVASTEVDADGQFAVDLLQGGPVKIVVWIGSMPGYVGGADLASATVYDLAPGDRVTGISRVESGLDIDFAGFSPFDAYYLVRIFDATGRDLTVSPSGMSGFNAYSNFLQLSNLTAGDVFLSLAPSNSRAAWLPQFYDRRDSLAAADPIAVPPDGQVGRLTVTFVTGGRIRGHILGADGEPVSRSFDVQLFAASDSSAYVGDYASWNLDYDHATGAYVLTQLRNGDYKLRARLHASPWRYWPGAESFADAGVVTIENLGEVTGIDLALPD